VTELNKVNKYMKIEAMAGAAHGAAKASFAMPKYRKSIQPSAGGSKKISKYRSLGI
jgi:hypothetical protein